jgi:hypothetical protein
MRSPWPSAIFAAFLKVSTMAGRVGLRVLAPLLHAELGGIDADDAVLTDAVLVEELGDAAGLLDREEELLLLFVGAHRGITHRAAPDRSHERADLQALGGDEVRHLLEVVLGDVGVGVRVEQEQVDAVELMAVDVGGDGHVEHALEGDRRVVGVGLLADEAGPHRVVQFHGRRGRGEDRFGAEGLLLLAPSCRRPWRGRPGSPPGRSSAGRPAARSCRCCRKVTPFFAPASVQKYSSSVELVEADRASGCSSDLAVDRAGALHADQAVGALVVDGALRARFDGQFLRR